jgi:hypothetical protein
MDWVGFEPTSSADNECKSFLSDALLISSIHKRAHIFDNTNNSQAAN